MSLTETAEQKVAPSRLRDRLARGVAANVYSQLVTIVLHLASLPALIAFWGVDRLGEWMVLTAIPAYLTIADLGFSQAGASAMSMKVAAGDKCGASHVFGAGLLLFYCLCFAIGIAGGLIGLLAPHLLLPGSLALSNMEGQVILALLVAHVVLGVLMGTIGGGLRSVGLNPWLVTVSTTGRLLEGCSTLVVAGLGGGFIAAAMAMLFVRLVSAIVLIRRLRRSAPWYRAKAFTNEGWHQFKVLFVPSISFLAYTLAQLLSIQGVTIAAGVIWGPATVVLLTALRTFSRLGIQAANMITYSWQPEYSRAFGDPEKRETLIPGLVRLHAKLIVPLTACYLALSLLIGHHVIEFWTHGQVKVVEPLLTLFVVSVALDMLWLSAQAFLIATNQHVSTSAIYVVCSLAGLLAVWVFGGSLGVDVVGYAGLAISIVMGGVMFYSAGSLRRSASLASH